MNRKKERIRSGGYSMLSVILTAATLITLLTGIPAKSLSKVQAKTVITLQNPGKAEGGQRIWDCVYFGTYPQSDPTGVKQDPIKWRVLSVNGNDAFLIADVILDVKPYTVDVPPKSAVTWEDCTLRSWLNGYGSESNKDDEDYTSDNFIDKAFTKEEQTALLTTTVWNDDNPLWGTNAGEDTEDKIFVLSYDEVTTPAYGFSSDYEENDEAKLRRNTAYVYAKWDSSYVSQIEGNTENWWLRTPGIYTFDAMFVRYYGAVYEYGYVANNPDCAVCPALHLDLSVSDVWKYAGAVYSDGTTVGKREGSVLEEKEELTDVSTENVSTQDVSTKEAGSEDKTTEDKTTADDPAATEAATVGVGSILTDATGTYKVTATGTNPTVTFAKPAKTGITKVKIPAKIKNGNIT